MIDRLKIRIRIAMQVVIFFLLSNIVTFPKKKCWQKFVQEKLPIF